MTIFKSASKIVFILMGVTVCGGFLIGKLPVDQFMVLSGMAFTFYFAKKDRDEAGEITK